MSDALEQRVEQFVQEILGLVEEVSTERPAAAINAVTAMLAGAGRSPGARAPASRGARTPRKAAASLSIARGRARVGLTARRRAPA